MEQVKFICDCAQMAGWASPGLTTEPCIVCGRVYTAAYDNNLNTLVAEEVEQLRMYDERTTTVISGFPGVGKSHLFDKKKGLVILDSDSSLFSWKSKGVRNPDFPDNYIEHIKRNMGKVDIILISTIKSVRDALKINNIPYIVAYPSIELKPEYIERYRRRGNDERFISSIETGWDDFIEDINKDSFPTKLRLESNEYLYDILNKPYCIIEECFCHVKETCSEQYSVVCVLCNRGRGKNYKIKLIPMK